MFGCGPGVCVCLGRERARARAGGIRLWTLSDINDYLCYYIRALILVLLLPCRCVSGPQYSPDCGQSGVEIALLMDRLQPLVLQALDPRLDSLLRVDAPWPQLLEWLAVRHDKR